jgi:hypothetical protein
MARPKGSKNKPKGEKVTTKTKAKAKPKARPAASASSEVVEASSKMPNKSQILGLAKRLDSYATQAKDLGESKKEMVDRAVETQHFNKAALGAALAWRRRAKKDPAKFSLEFAHFLAYIDDLELDRIANEARGLNLEGDEDEAEDDGQVDLEEAIEAAPARGLRVVPGPAAPESDFEIPPAPGSDEEAA